MKGLTLTQPWATLVAIGAKRIETRSWPTRYRGLLAIHAGAGLGPAGGLSGLHELAQRDMVRAALAAAGYESAPALPRGAIVATALLIDCQPTSGADGSFDGVSGGIRYRWPLSAHELAFGDYRPGRFGWLLLDVQRLPEPVPCRGGLGLWNVPAEVEASVMSSLQPDAQR
jgi:hypothetical protein